MPRVPSPLPEIFLATPRLASRISRALKEGRVRKLAPSLYTTNLTEAPESLVRRQLWQIASLVFPDAVITDRTAFEAGPSSDGSVFLAAGTARDVALPGVTLRAREGNGPLLGDTPFLGLHMAPGVGPYAADRLRPRGRSMGGDRASRRAVPGGRRGRRDGLRFRGYIAPADCSCDSVLGRDGPGLRDGDSSSGLTGAKMRDLDDGRVEGDDLSESDELKLRALLSRLFAALSESPSAVPSGIRERLSAGCEVSVVP